MNMMENSSTGTQPQSQTLLAKEFANGESDRYRGLLEARIASLKKDIADMQEAMKTVGASGAGHYYKEITKCQESIARLSEKLGRVVERDAVFRKALIFETVEEATEKMTTAEKEAYFQHLAELRDRRISKDPAGGESFMGFIKKLFF